MSHQSYELPAPGQSMAADFIAEEKGSMTILSLFLFVCMVIISGISIDLMVHENNRARLQSVSDRAALAATDLDQRITSNEIVASYFEKEGQAANLRGVQVSQGINQRTVRVDTSKEERTMFLNFWNHTGIDSLTASTLSVATEARTDLEISLVLDVSASMRDRGSRGSDGRRVAKIDSLKSAAGRFVDKVYESGDPDRITMSVVPYSTQVNVGPIVREALGVTARQPHSDCLVFEASDFNETRIRSGNAYAHSMHFDPYYYEMRPQLYSCRPEANVMTKPIMGNPVQIKTEINALTADGNTSIDVGLKWGAAFLDPSSRVVTNALANASQIEDIYRDRPFDWNRGNSEKFIVLLTDGINTDQKEIRPDYATGPSGVWRWIPNPAVPQSFYSWNSPEVGDEDGDGISGERYWTPGFTLPTLVTGLSEPITITQGWTNDPVGRTLSELQVEGADTAQRAARLAAVIAALSPANQPPVELDFATLWNEMAVNHFAWEWVRVRHGGSTTQMDAFYNAVWSNANRRTKNTRTQALCQELRTAGVTIFTIGFEVNNSAADVMRDCASNPNYFIRVVGNDLERAFDQIANTISNLRLTQ